MYYLRARLFPSVLTCLPFLVLINKVVLVAYADVLNNIHTILPILTSMGISAAIIFGFVMLNRIAAKEIFQRLYFRSEREMPTTTHLLLSDNHFDHSFKEMVRKKIEEKFAVRLLDEQEEKKDIDTAKSKISAAVILIRGQQRSNDLLLQHNTEYGFFRNLAGGSFLAVLASIFLIVIAAWQHNWPLVQLGVLFVVIYAMPILTSKYFMQRLGNYYSKVLFEAFLTQP